MRTTLVLVLVCFVACVYTQPPPNTACTIMDSAVLIDRDYNAAGRRPSTSGVGGTETGFRYTAVKTGKVMSMDMRITGSDGRSAGSGPIRIEIWDNYVIGNRNLLAASAYRYNGQPIIDNGRESTISFTNFDFSAANFTQTQGVNYYALPVAAPGLYFYQTGDFSTCRVYFNGVNGIYCGGASNQPNSIYQLYVAAIDCCSPGCSNNQACVSSTNPPATLSGSCSCGAYGGPTCDIFPDPVISSVSIAPLNTVDLITIYGDYFQYSINQVLVQWGFQRNPGSVVSVDNQKIVWKYAPDATIPQESDIPLFLTVNGKEISSSYDTQAPNFTFSGSVPGEGGSLPLTITNLIDDNPHMIGLASTCSMISPTGVTNVCHVQYSLESSSIIIFFNAGTGKNWKIKISYYGLEDPDWQSSSFSYLPPYIRENFDPNPNPTPIIPTGSYYGDRVAFSEIASVGADSTKVTATVGGQPCTQLVVQPYNGFMCNVPAGTGSKSVTVTVDGQTSTFPDYFTYAGVITQGAWGPPTEGGFITVMGKNFGLDPTIFELLVTDVNYAGGEPKFINQSCTNPTFQQVSQYSNDKYFVCWLPIVGTWMDCKLYLKQTKELLGESNMMAKNPEVKFTSGVAYSGGVTTVLGSSFGTFGPDSKVTYYDFSIFASVSLRIYSWDHTKLVCDAPARPPGQQAPFFSIATMGPSDGGLFNYSEPVISQVVNTYQAGGVVTIHGSYFGNVLSNVTATINAVNCAMLTVTDAKITCNIPAGTGTNLNVTVNVLYGTSNTAKFSYEIDTTSTSMASTSAVSTSAASTSATSTSAASTSSIASTTGVTTSAASTSAASTSGVTTSAASTSAASTSGASTSAASTSAASTSGITTSAASTSGVTTSAASTSAASTSSIASTTGVTTSAASTSAASTSAVSTSAASTSAASTSAESTSATSTSAASTSAASTSDVSTSAASTSAVSTSAAATTAAAATTGSAETSTGSAETSTGSAETSTGFAETSTGSEPVQTSTTGSEQSTGSAQTSTGSEPAQTSTGQASTGSAQTSTGGQQSGSTGTPQPTGVRQTSTTGTQPQQTSSTGVRQTSTTGTQQTITTGTQPQQTSSTGVRQTTSTGVRQTTATTGTQQQTVTTGTQPQQTSSTGVRQTTSTTGTRQTLTSSTTGTRQTTSTSGNPSPTEAPFEETTTLTLAMELSGNGSNVNTSRVKDSFARDLGLDPNDVEVKVEEYEEKRRIVAQTLAKKYRLIITILRVEKLNSNSTAASILLSNNTSSLVTALNNSETLSKVLKESGASIASVTATVDTVLVPVGTTSTTGHNDSPTIVSAANSLYYSPVSFIITVFSIVLCVSNLV